MADLLAHTQTYLALAAAALALGALAGISLGVCASRVSWTRTPILLVANLGRVIPSLALLTFMLPVFGVGFKPAVAALALLAAAPITIITDVAFRNVPGAAVDAARGMGMTASQIFTRVQWPLAFPVMFSGVRTAAIEVVASAVLASFVGAGGLGDYVTSGLQANQPQELWTGVIAIAIIALATEFSLAAAARRIGKDLA